MPKRVAVFGGSQPQAGDPTYQLAMQLGASLAQAGYAVMNGGYIGTMEAVSRGAAQAGGQVIGVTCAEIEAWRPVKPNAWITEEWRCQTLRERLWALVDNCDAAIALPGGVGTLAEIALLWNHLLAAIIPPRPLIVLGAGWQAVFNQLFEAQGDQIPPPQRKWLLMALDVDSAIRQLSEWLSSGKV